MTEAEQIAAFIARKGVTRVATGASALGDMTARDWAKAARSTTRINAATRIDDEQQRLIDERYVVVDHLGRERVRNGLGEWIA